jgi:uncharacterized protein YdiU (UPF0061 family)
MTQHLSSIVLSKEGLSTKQFKNDFVTTFDGDESGNIRPRQTPGVLYSKALPTPVKNPKLIAWSDDLSKDLGIEKPTSQAEVDILAGNLVTPAMYPYAACYGGHQFGHWAGQLGDGRAITLGEWEAPDGNFWELQLKGAGQTAYSRRADGRAVLRSSVREYLMSEAMYYLGVPTTRALSLVSTGDNVLRDMFYDGHPEYEPGAIVMRVSPSFLRFGNFEILAARNEIDQLRKLTDWSIERFYPHIKGEEKILLWFGEIVERTAFLIAEWLRVGFVHGVMNTDNMSILGLTIDYGPYSFLDDYDRSFTPNTTDLPGRRYAFGRQPSIAHWNLGCLGSAVAPLLDSTDELTKVLDSYTDIFINRYHNMMGKKLGLDKVNPDDIHLINDFENLLAAIKPDMTIFYQLLIDLPVESDNAEDVVAHFSDCLYRDLQPSEGRGLYSLMRSYINRLGKNSIDRQESQSIMRKNNPRFILRNYLLHQSIEDLTAGNDELFLKLQQAMKEPYSTNFDEFFIRRPDWATQKAGCSMLSCSS